MNHADAGYECRKQIKLWKTHFETILNKEANFYKRNRHPWKRLDESCQHGTTIGSRRETAVDNNKLGKARGADGVSAEMLKAGDAITETITEIYKEIGNGQTTTKLGPT